MFPLDVRSGVSKVISLFMLYFKIKLDFWLVVF
jgi:hypothetical protein